MSTTRDDLIEAAAALVEAGGPAAVTLREVGRRAGVSHNAPYRHFESKEELLAAVAARELRRPYRGSRVGAGEAVRSMLRGHIARAVAHPELFKLTYGTWRTENAELTEAAADARRSFVTAVHAAQESGELPKGDAERLASLLHALAHGAIDLALSGHLSSTGKGRAEPAELVDDLLRILATTSS